MGARRGRQWVWLVALGVSACAGPLVAPVPAAPVVAEPLPAVVASVESSIPSPAPPPAPGPPEELRTFAGCDRPPHGLCDFYPGDSLCKDTEEHRLAMLDELVECVREAAVDGDRLAALRARTLARGEAWERRRASFAWTILQIAFRDGAVPATAGERLVRAGVASRAQAKALAQARQLVPRALAGQAREYRALSSKQCRPFYDTKAPAIALRCQAWGKCSGGCGMAHHYEATIGVDESGLHLIEVADRPQDEPFGHCGCCGIAE